MLARLSSLPLVLAGLRHERGRARARVPGPGLRARHGVGAAARHRAGRALGGLLVDVGDQPRAVAPRLPTARPSRRHDAPTRSALARRSGSGRGRARSSPGSRETFNEMLDRLEFERRDSARRALLVQEGERRRIARELHDEVGQTLTGVMLQVEGLAAAIPDELREQLDELRETARLAPRTCVASRASCGRRRSRISDCRARSPRSRRRVRRTGPRPSAPASRAAAPAALRGAGARDLSRRAGGDDQRRPSRRRDAPSSCGSNATEDQVILTVRDDGRGLPPGRADILARDPRHARTRDADRCRAGDRAGTGSRHRDQALHPHRSHGRHDNSTEDAHPRRRRPSDRPARAEDGAQRPARLRGRRRSDRRRAGRRPRTVRRRASRDPRHLDAAQDRPAGRPRDHAPQARGARADALDARQRAVPLRGDQGRRLRLRAQERRRPRPRRGLPRRHARRAVPLPRRRHAR